MDVIAKLSNVRCYSYFFDSHHDYNNKYSRRRLRRWHLDTEQIEVVQSKS